MYYFELQSIFKSVHTIQNILVFSTTYIKIQFHTSSLAKLGANPITYIRFLQMILISPNKVLFCRFNSLKLYRKLGESY